MTMSFKLIREILKGKDLTRTFMNVARSRYTLSGKVLVIGVGTKQAISVF